VTRSTFVPNRKIGYAVLPLAATALLGMACSNNNSSNTSNNAAATKAASSVATIATTPAAATTRAATPVAGAATRVATPVAGAATSAAARTATPVAVGVGGASGSPRAGSPTAGSPAAGASAVTTTNAAIDLRVTLDQLLSEHAFLAMVAMQKGYDGAPDFKAAADQLDQNSVALGKAVDSVYPGAGAKFLDLWRAHIGMFVDYTVGSATKDQAKKDKALADLAGYRKDFGAFINGANPNLPADAVAGLLQTHVNELVAALDSYAAKDYAKTYQQFDEAYKHMFATGDALAGGIVKQSPNKFAGDPMSKAAGLRVALDTLLSEHANLAILAMQKGVNGAADFKPLADQLDKNSVELSQAVDSVYPGAGAKFLDLWRAHIGMFVDYTVGTATKDQAKRDKALADLAGYRKDFGAFINGANPNLPADAVAGLLQQHVNELISALDSYVAKDYVKTYAQFDEADKHMFTTGDALAAGIVKQSPNKFALALGVDADNDLAAVLTTGNDYTLAGLESTDTGYSYSCTITF